jgi:uncharacterized membrane protein YdjX (TVP38/TMEM64 family)
MNQNKLKILILLIITSIIAAFFILDLQQYATLDYIKEQQYALQNYLHQNFFVSLAVFGFIYIIITAFSLPAATILTLLGGALFGFITGLIMVSFASSIGASCAFLMARFLLKDSVQEKYGKYLKNINEGFKREGAFYLFAMRLVPIIPFFVINILMGITPIKARIFYLVSQIGMLPGTAVYVYAGTELGKIKTLSDISSPSLLLAFTLLGLFPIIARKSLNFLRKEKIA